MLAGRFDCEHLSMTIGIEGYAVLVQSKGQFTVRASNTGQRARRYELHLL